MKDERAVPASSATQPLTATHRHERREQELSFTAEVTHTLATAEDAREVLGLILDRLRMLLGCEIAAVVGTVQDSPELVVEAAAAADRTATRLVGRRFARAETMVDRALRDARPITLRPDGAAVLDPLLQELLGDRVPESGMVLPIRGPAGLELGGLIALNMRDRILPADIRFLLALADHAAIAMHRARSVRTRSDDAVRVKVLSTVLQATTAGLDEDGLLRHAVEALLAALPADATEVVLRDGGELRLRFAYPGPGGAGTHAQALHLRAIERGEPTASAGGESSSDGAAAPLCMAAVPLQARDRSLGSLLVARKSPPYGARELELLTAVGRHLGLALELSRLFRRAAVEADELERLAAERSSALRATQEQLARSQWLASLGEIAAGVAHDLNNSLNPIVAFAELIKEHVDQPDKVRTYAERILMAAQGGAETVRRIQRFTRHRLGAAPSQPISVAGLVRDAIELIRPSLGERAETVEVVESVEPQLLVNGNPGELRQALLNLITNALDAMPDGGTLRFVTRADGDHVVISVQDTGTGMPQDIRTRALEPFFTTKGAHGTGLGLAEVFGIVRRHGGTLELETWPNVGTTVMLRLPPPGVRREAASETRPGRGSPGHSFRILLVDDNVLGLEATAASLRAAGHAVVTAANADAALQLFRAGRYDVVLSDLGLPDMSGWELIERLRGLDPDVRIGVVTGWAVPESDEEIKRRGVEIVLTKPVDPERLLAFL